MKGGIYSKPVLFAVVAAVVILIGTIVVVFIPILTPQMHVKLENLKPYTALQLAGRDVYISEGCHYCHTQTVRPLKAEVMRYGAFSKAGEFAYDHPFLWGTKRTGPDLARIGGKYPDAWHYAHLENSKNFFPDSNMPSYAWLKNNKLNPARIERSMRALGFPYTAEEIAALDGKTQMDALVAYLQVIGTAVTAKAIAPKIDVLPEDKNPFAGDPKFIAKGKTLYDVHCLMCHGVDGKGIAGLAPSVVDNIWLDKEGDVTDGVIYIITANGTMAAMEIAGRTAKGGMPPFGAAMSRQEIWAMVTYMRSLQK